MVRVLANGELVEDDDPRAQASNTTWFSERRTPFTQSLVLRQNPHVQTSWDNWRVAGARVAARHINAINSWFNSIGFPTWHLGQYSVEPLFSITILTSSVIAGNRGFIFSVALFFAVKYFRLRCRDRNPTTEQNSRPSEQRPNSNNQNSSQAFSGSGHRLGRA